MEGMGGDLFATKGLEYMLVIGYLLLLVGCRRMVGPRRSRSRTEESTFRPAEVVSFDLREGFHFHQGHAWAIADGDGIMRVGVDDFAQKRLGSVSGVILPRIGERLREGEPGWKVRVGRMSIPMLSPVEGEVVAWNEQVLASPELLNREPYDGGWLLEVKVPNPTAAQRNLLSDNLAHAWADEVVARHDDPSVADTSLDARDRLAREFLLSKDEADWSPYGADARHEAGRGQKAQFA